MRRDAILILMMSVFALLLWVVVELAQRTMEIIK